MPADNFYSWRPSVISVKNPKQDNAYVGNVINGVNVSKTEVIQQVSSLGAESIQQINAEGDLYIQQINDLLVKYRTVSNILDELFAVFVEEYGEPDPDIVSGKFELGSSQLDSAILG